MVELLGTVSDVVPTPLNETVARGLKLAPEMVKDVPPEDGPEPGVILVMEGGGTKVKPFVKVAVTPPGLITTTFTVPALSAGVTAVNWVELTKVTEVPARPPNCTVATDWKAVPFMVTLVPPAVGPLGGDTLVTAGVTT